MEHTGASARALQTIKTIKINCDRRVSAVNLIKLLQCILWQRDLLFVRTYVVRFMYVKNNNQNAHCCCARSVSVVHPVVWWLVAAAAAGGGGEHARGHAQNLFMHAVRVMLMFDAFVSPANGTS